MRIASDVRAVWAQSWVTPWVFPLIVMYKLTLGVVLIVGGDERINGPAWSVIHDLGAAPVGTIFVVLGLGTLVTSMIGRVPLNVVSMAVAIAHLLLAAGFLAAVLSEPPVFDPDTIRPSLVGPPTYLFIAAVHFANAFVYGSRGPLGSRE